MPACSASQIGDTTVLHRYFDDRAKAE